MKIASGCGSNSIILLSYITLFDQRNSPMMHVINSLCRIQVAWILGLILLYLISYLSLLEENLKLRTFAENSIYLANVSRLWILF